MQSAATTVDQYIDELPEERQAPVKKLRQVIKKNIPKGFTEGMGYGMIGFAVPHKLYPQGYHCDPKLPLPFMSIGSQKNYIALHHMGLYADPKLLQWFTNAYAENVPTKLDMGKGCIRFKKPEQIPFELIGELATKMSTQQWIDTYESAFRKK